MTVFTKAWQRLCRNKKTNKALTSQNNCFDLGAVTLIQTELPTKTMSESDVIVTLPTGSKTRISYVWSSLLTRLATSTLIVVGAVVENACATWGKSRVLLLALYVSSTSTTQWWPLTMSYRQILKYNINKTNKRCINEVTYIRFTLTLDRILQI